MEATTYLEVKNLTKEFGTQKAVNNISFEAKKGEILGFLGPNGAGKSTTMKIATGYLPSTEGSIFVCGFDVRKSPLEVKKRIGYLPEHNPLYLDMYVREYLEFVGKIHNIVGKKLQERITEVIDLVGLGREKNKQIGALSKGYRQRVGLGAALIHNPEVLILDEPTTGLDPNQIQEIRSLIKEISKEKTIVFSTHIMQEVQALCDKVVIINQGEIVANDKVSNLKLDQNEVKISITFTTKIDKSKFEENSSISEIEVLSENKYTFLIARNDAKNDEVIRAELFKIAVQNDWIIIEMIKEISSLENIFKKLTDNRKS